MAVHNKRSWKLQQFVAHNANVNCVSLGHKSGRVMVTGGDDMKVNLWAIGKQSLFMSLSGHTTPVDCVQFNCCEELVCAGSRAGALKLWDLEAAKLVRTLTGHRDAIKCIDFSPDSDFIASGSTDCTIKLWDSRRKGCLFTYAGHKAQVNSIKFSPDGYWLASGGDDFAVKIWDLRIGRVLKEFGEHEKVVSCVEFHPREFLLASGGGDGTVNLYDLESFGLVSSERDLGSVRCLWFNPSGECLFAGVRDYLKVVGWEPSRLFDSVPVNWRRICDISTTQSQLVGASYNHNQVLIYVVDLNKVQPLSEHSTTLVNISNASYSTDGDATLTPSLVAGGGNTPASPFANAGSLRKSFSKADRPVDLKKNVGSRLTAAGSSGAGGAGNTSLEGRTIEESTSGTDPEEDATADITNITDYNEIFKAVRSLNRTPPPPEPFVEPDLKPFYIDPTEPQILSDFGDHHHHQQLEALSLDHSVNYFRPTQSQSTTTSPTSELLPPLPPGAATARTAGTPPSPYSRSKSNLDTVYSNRTAGGRRDLVQGNNNINVSRGANTNLLTISNGGGGGSTKSVNKFNLQRQSSCKEETSASQFPDSSNRNNIRQCTSEANLSASAATAVVRNVVQRAAGSRKNSISSRPVPPSRTTGSVPNVSSKIPRNNNVETTVSSNRTQRGTPVVEIFATGGGGNKAAAGDSGTSSPDFEEDLSGGFSGNSDDYVIPERLDRPAGLEMDDFMPRPQSTFDLAQRQRLGENETMLSEAEVLSVVMRSHETMLTLFGRRQRNLKMAMAQGRIKGSKAALEMAITMDDMSVFVDLLGVYNDKYTLWNLEMCAAVLPKIQELIQSKYETYVSTACATIKLILRHFGPVIKDSVQTPAGSFGVDLSREDRYRRSVKCQESFDTIRSIILKKQSSMMAAGGVGAAFKEVYALIKNTLE